MLKTACLLTGDNYSLLSADTPASKKKVVAMSIAMLVPTLIWIFNGFMLSYQVLESGLGWAILTALICGTIVFLIEKLIVMANGNKWLTFFRVCIGVIVALLGSIAIDEVVFKNDIDISVAGIKEKTIAGAKMEEEKIFNKLNHITELNNEIKIAQVKYDAAAATAIAEADGTNGTGHRGLGNVTKFKDQKAKERKMDMNELLVKQEGLMRAKNTLINEAGIKAAVTFQENALLTRIKALFTIVIKDTYMLVTYILFTLLMFFFEFLVVILKLTWKKTNYERKVEMIEEVGQKRMEFLQRKDSLLTDPGYYLPQLEQARDALKKNSSFYN
jgi:hypothetical protein